MQIRIDPKNVKPLKTLAKRNHRKPTHEANLAIDAHLASQYANGAKARRVK